MVDPGKGDVVQTSCPEETGAAAGRVEIRQQEGLPGNTR